MQLSSANILNPVDHGLLVAALTDVKNPAQKIKYLVATGEIKPVMRGWYLVNEALENYSLMYAANIFYGPSYVSRLTALSYLGWLTDVVIVQESVCFKRGKAIDNSIGRFVYYKQDCKTFHLGVNAMQQGPRITIRIASPTKALYDYLITEPNLVLTGKSNLFDFLENDLRFATERLHELDVPLLKELAKHGQKTRQIKILIDLIESIR
ncbi:MAG: hypothetical protein RL660_1543 [Bacteroidota bacterium]|jgi:hypothetical protein